MSQSRELAVFLAAERGRAGMLPPRCPTCGHRRVVRHGLFAMALGFAEQAFDMDQDQLLARCQLGRHVEARSFIVWALRTLAAKPLSYARIGKLLGGYDHSTMVHLHQKALNLRLRDTDFSRHCAAFIAQLDLAKETAHEARH